MENGGNIFSDLQRCLLFWGVRCGGHGMQKMIGVVNVIPAPALPVTCMRLCIWARWCSGTGKFKQRSRIVGVDEQQVIAQAEVEFVQGNGRPRNERSLLW